MSGERSITLATAYWLFAVYLLAPIALTALMSLRDSNYVGFPIHEWTFRWYLEVAGDRDVIRAFAYSLLVALASTALALAIGVPTAIFMGASPPVVRALLLPIVLMPAFIPIIVSGISLRMHIRLLGIEPGFAAIVFGHAVGSVPFVVIMILTRLDTMSRTLIEAALDLGADRFIAFARITVPFLMPSLFGAFMFCILLSFEDFVRSFFLAGFDQTLPMLLFARMRFGIGPDLSVISTLTLLFTMAVGLYAERYMRQRRLRTQGTI